jgi:hypothetical protein
MRSPAPAARPAPRLLGICGEHADRPREREQGDAEQEGSRGARGHRGSSISHLGRILAVDPSGKRSGHKLAFEPYEPGQGETARRRRAGHGLGAQHGLVAQYMASALNSPGMAANVKVVGASQRHPLDLFPSMWLSQEPQTQNR